MKYIMKSGVLYLQGKVMARIKSSVSSPAKKILSADGCLLLQVNICNMGTPPNRQGDVRFREYIMDAGQETPLATAKPGYAEGNDPMINGWPFCRLPKVDHAEVQINGTTYCLTMQNCRSYLLTESTEKNFCSGFAQRTVRRMGHRSARTFQPGADMRYLRILPVH